MISFDSVCSDISKMCNLFHLIYHVKCKMGLQIFNAFLYLLIKWKTNLDKLMAKNLYGFVK